MLLWRHNQLLLRPRKTTINDSLSLDREHSRDHTAFDGFKPGYLVSVGLRGIVCSLGILILIRFVIVRLSGGSSVKGGSPMNKQIVKDMGISILETLQAIGTNIFATVLLT